MPTAIRFSGNQTFAYSDLQAAIDDAVAGDRIELGAGTWDGGLVIDGKSQLEVVAPGGNATTFIDGGGVDRGIQITNSSDIQITGLTITKCVGSTTAGGGSGSPTPSGYGGGILAASCASLSVSHCRFLDNAAHEVGGGFAASLCPYLEISNCQFEDNTAILAYGGGAAIEVCDHARVLDSTFTGNSSDASNGGALSVASHNLFTTEIRRCVFRDNDARTGGAMALWGFTANAPVTATVAQCTFMANRTTGTSLFGGGAMVIGDAIGVDIEQCRFTQNRAPSGGAIRVAGSGPVEISDTFLAGNRGADGSDNIRMDSNSTVRIARSGTDCQHTLANSVNGAWTDLQGNGQLGHCAYTADINFDGEVAMGDLLVLLSQWGNVPLQQADIDRAPGEQGPSRVDAADLVRMLDAWADNTTPLN